MKKKNEKRLKGVLFCSRMRKAGNAFIGLNVIFFSKKGWLCQNLLNLFKGSNLRQTLQNPCLGSDYYIITLSVIVDIFQNTCSRMCPPAYLSAPRANLRTV